MTGITRPTVILTDDHPSLDDRIAQAKQELGIEPNKDVSERAQVIRQAMEGTTPDFDLQARTQAARDSMNGKRPEEVQERINATKRDLGIPVNEAT